MIQDVESRILDLLAEKLGVRPTSADKLAHLNLDSLALAEFSADLEKSFDVRLDEHVLDLNTVGDMVTYVSRLCERRERDATAGNWKLGRTGTGTGKNWAVAAGERHCQVHAFRRLRPRHPSPVTAIARFSFPAAPTQPPLIQLA